MKSFIIKFLCFVLFIDFLFHQFILSLFTDSNFIFVDKFSLLVLLVSLVFLTFPYLFAMTENELDNLAVLNLLNMILSFLIGVFIFLFNFLLGNKVMTSLASTMFIVPILIYISYCLIRVLINGVN